MLVPTPHLPAVLLSFPAADQVPACDRPRYVSTLIQQIAQWAADELRQAPPSKTQPKTCGAAVLGLTRMQQVVQLAFNAVEDAAVISWFKTHLTAGQPGGEMLPVYLLLVRQLWTTLSVHMN